MKRRRRAFDSSHPTMPSKQTHSRCLVVLLSFRNNFYTVPYISQVNTRFESMKTLIRGNARARTRAGTQSQMFFSRCTKENNLPFGVLGCGCRRRRRCSRRVFLFVGINRFLGFDKSLHMKVMIFARP